ncbi:hypothetical protein ANANG_G00162540 [Anguilla anguilla]|uniref:Uncharacterized protein n=1 Tax=Anguilla anguilla TaxID=7936 RepID=A0A9D3RVC4_ANGAN|nr:hypothetical protein ANANG_G00162540 [Anguilla anguilla]
MDGSRSGGLRKKRRSRSERDRERRSKGLRNNHVRGGMLRLSSDSEREESRNPSSSRPRPPRRKRKESTSAEEDIIDGFSISGFMTLEALQKDMSVKPQDRADSQPGPLHKRRLGRVANGLSLGPRKNRHLLQHSDQENNPRLAHALSKKKRLGKRHRPLKPGQNNCKDSDSESVSGESKPSFQSSSRDQLSDCDSESDQEDKGSDANSEKLFSTVTNKVPDFSVDALAPNDSQEARGLGVPKVSGLERSQERSKESARTPQPALSPVPPPAPSHPQPPPAPALSRPPGQSQPAWAAPPPVPLPPQASVFLRQQPQPQLHKQQPEQHPGQAARPSAAPAPAPAPARLGLPPPPPHPDRGPQLPAGPAAVLPAPQYVRASGGLASTSTAHLKHSAGPPDTLQEVLTQNKTCCGRS